MVDVFALMQSLRYRAQKIQVVTESYKDMSRIFGVREGFPAQDPEQRLYSGAFSILGSTGSPTRPRPGSTTRA